MTDMNKHKVVVTGKIDPQKVLKKLRKKTGKKVEIVKNDNKLLSDHDEDHLKALKDGPIGINCVNNLQGVDWSLYERDLQVVNMGFNSYDHYPILKSEYYCNDTEMLITMFNDENPNACSVM